MEDDKIISEAKMRSLAVKREKLALIQSLVKDKLDRIDTFLKIILKKRSFTGMAIIPGQESCRPSWKSEWKTLCEELHRDPELEEEKAKERVGKSPSESKVAIDTEFCPNEEVIKTIIEWIEEI